MRYPKWRNTFLLLVISLAIMASLVNGRRRKNRNRKRSSNSRYMSDFAVRRNFVIVSGDIYFGALIQIHNGGRNDICGNLSHTAILELEALLYTVEMINIHTSLLPGIKLGVYVRDTCADPDHALKQALTIMEGRYSESPRWSYRCRGGEIAKSLLPTINGIITSIDSPAANVQAASLLQLFRLPQINAKSRSPLLRTVGRFPYLHHSVPTYFQQLNIVIELLKHLKWSYINVIFEDSEYGAWLTYKLQEILRNNRVCIAANIMIPPFSNTLGKKQSYDMIATRLLRHPLARGVLIVTESDETAAAIIAGVKRQGGSRRIAFLGIGWGKNIKYSGIENELEGTLVLQLTENAVISFDDYMDQKKPNKNKRNPWFQKFWQEVFKCKLPSDKYNRSHHYNFGKVRLCTGKEDVAKYVNSVQTDAEHLSNAIMAFAQTLHNIHWDYCQGVPGICDAMKPLSGEVLSKYLESVRFKSMSGKVFEFHADREPKGEYRLMNFQRISHGQYKWISLGKSRTKFSNETLRAIKFRDIEPIFPASFCSLPCEPNHVQVSHSEEDCCFVCVPCPPDHYMPSERECIPCPNGTTPTLDHRTCVPSLSGNRKSTSAAERREPTNSTAEKVKQTTRRKKIPSATKKAEGERRRNKSAANKLQYVSNETNLNYTLTNSSAEDIEWMNQTLDLDMDELAGLNETEEETESFPGKKKNEARIKTKISKPNKNVKQKKGKNIAMVSNSTSQNLTEETNRLPDENLQNNGTKARKNQKKSIDDINKNVSKSAGNSEKTEVFQSGVTTAVFLDGSSKNKSTINSTETITKISFKLFQILYLNVDILIFRVQISRE
ncbi:metabotropic glutamate receptor 6-like [Octopus vulgaris]|uniref:Metabotropic glutamate receptor 6-like n=1 Tax=Octopus vulgaris TaxID=6645 RepID=A0AA36BBH4_OCTVU|nr:metabotropic glutamate receptor 6-like [Octopus vulgaris]